MKFMWKRNKDFSEITNKVMLEAILKKFNLQEILKPATSEMSEDKCKNLNTWKM